MQGGSLASLRTSGPAQDCGKCREDEGALPVACQADIAAAVQEGRCLVDKTDFAWPNVTLTQLCVHACMFTFAEPAAGMAGCDIMHQGVTSQSSMQPRQLSYSKATSCHTGGSASGSCIKNGACKPPVPCVARTIHDKLVQEQRRRSRMPPFVSLKAAWHDPSEVSSKPHLVQSKHKLIPPAGISARAALHVAHATTVAGCAHAPVQAHRRRWH